MLDRRWFGRRTLELRRALRAAIRRGTQLTLRVPEHAAEQSRVQRFDVVGAQRHEPLHALRPGVREPGVA